MNFNQLALELARERQEREIAELTRARFETSIPRPSIRRSIGRLVIAAGERIAADQPLELARSR